MVEQTIASVRPGAQFPHLGAFESTKLMGSGTDILGTTRHVERWQDDLQMLCAASLQTLRYSVPWHRIERSPGSFDFSWIDGPMSFMQRNGMTPILDPLHHISFPDWLDQGFANPDFPARYEKFVTEIAKRYPWANVYTIFNEPLPTTLFCSYTGGWYPHQASDDCFVRMALNVARAICRASAAVSHVIPDARFVHVETCEVHRAMDGRCEPWARFTNARRFLMHDLILGRVDKTHELYTYLHKHGLAEDDIGWLADNRASFDVLGLDYYIQSEMEWMWDSKLRRPNISWPVQQPAGFATVARDYVNRFDVPVMLSETNLKGTYLDRLTWLKFMEEQCETIAKTSDFRGFCWYPSIDSTDWCHFCTQATGTVDPQGIWRLDRSRWKRHASELSDYYTRLAAGKVRSEDLPAYIFSEDTAKHLVGYQNLRIKKK